MFGINRILALVLNYIFGYILHFLKTSKHHAGRFNNNRLMTSMSSLITHYLLLSLHYTSKIFILYLINRHLLQRQYLPSISFSDNFGKSAHQHETSFWHEKISPHSVHFLLINYLIVYLALY